MFYEIWLFNCVILKKIGLSLTLMLINNMKKSVIALFLLVILLISPIAIAQEQYQNYSEFSRFFDNVVLFFSGGDAKVNLALEIREKEVNSALKDMETGDTVNAIRSLNNAKDKLKLVQENVSLNTSEKVKQSVEAVKNKIDKNTLPEEFYQYKLEEEKTQLTTELTLKTFEYCKALAQENYGLMLKQEKCNPETAPAGLKQEFEQLKQLQKESFNKFMYDIRSCIDDPGTCNCEDNEDITQKAKCEQMVALAVRCEYKDEESACDELISMKPTEDSGFAESFIPSFLLDMFKEKEYMIDYHIPKSDGVPEECYNENESVKTECAQYRYKKEIHGQCFDAEGNFLVEKCGGPDEKTPTMQESIPQCYNENNEFLFEKCGEVTIVWNDEGLINYLFEGDLNNIIENLETSSEQNTIEVNGKNGQTLINDIKEEIDGIEGQIAERTFAPGTYGTGDGGNTIGPDVDGNNGDDGLEPEINTGNGGNGDDGLTPEINTGNGGSNGDGGLEPEVKTYHAGDGTEQNDPLPTSSGNETHYNPSQEQVVTNNIDVGEVTNIIDP